VDVRRGDRGEAFLDFVVEAEDVRHLGRITAGLRRVQGVRHVQRSQRI